MSKWKHPGLVTKVMIVITTVEAVAAAGSGILSFAGEAAQYTADQEDLSPVQMAHALFDTLHLSLFVGLIVGIFWFRRAAINARSFDRHLEVSPNWGWLWYIVPFAGWFVPCQKVALIWSASGGKGYAILAVWWGGWVTFNLISVFDNLVNRLVGQDAGSPVAGLMDLAWAVSSVAFILLALQLSKLQVAMRDTSVFSDGEDPQRGVLNFA